MEGWKQEDKITRNGTSTRFEAINRWKLWSELWTWIAGVREHGSMHTNNHCVDVISNHPPARPPPPSFHSIDCWACLVWSMQAWYALSMIGSVKCKIFNGRDQGGVEWKKWKAVVAAAAFRASPGSRHRWINLLDGVRRDRASCSRRANNANQHFKRTSNAGISGEENRLWQSQVLKSLYIQ